MKESTEPMNIAPNEVRETPFVNEECGDTMWNPVLKELEDKLANAFGKPAGQSTEKSNDNTEQSNSGNQRKAY